MSNRRIRKEPFWKLAIRYAVVFMIVLTIIQVGLEVVNGRMDELVASFGNWGWVQKAINTLIVGVVYGVTMAFIMKKKAQKRS